MTARDELREYVNLLADPKTPRETTDGRVERLYGQVRAEVLNKVLGDDLNPSNLVLDARAYHTLVTAIEATMDDPDRWDSDEAEVAILARYVEWLQVRVAELGAERDELNRLIRSSKTKAVLPAGLVAPDTEEEKS